MKSKFIAFVLLTCALHSQQNIAKALDLRPEAVKIGLLICLSGDCAADGNQTMRSAQLAAEEINANGGILGKRIEFVIQDTNEAISGAKAVSAYRQMRLDPEVHYFIGPSWTPAGLAVAPIVAHDRDSVIMASPSLGAPEFHRAGNNIFNVRGTDEVSSRTEARYAFDKGARRVAILSSQQPWETQQATFFEDEFKKLGGTVVIRQEPLPSVTDISPEVAKIVQSKPDAVYFASIILMSRGAKELARLKYTGLKIGSVVDEPRINESGGTLDNTVFFAFQKPSEKFRQKFQQKWQELPQSVAAVAYDTVYVFANAMKKAGSIDVAKVKAAMVETDFLGTSGQIRFDPERCAIRSPQGWVVSGSDYTSLDGYGVG